MNHSDRERRDRGARVVRGIVLAIGIGVWSSGAAGQYYPPSGGSRKSVSLRSNLMVGQGPSTINTMNMRAYSTGLENVIRPTDSAAGGVLGSSIYGGVSYSGPRPVSGGPGASGAALPPPRPMHSPQGYAPSDPLRIGVGGSVPAGGASLGSLMAPSAESAPATAPGRPENLPRGRITSLVPRVPWDYKDQMVAGEKAFRKGDYPEAFSRFEKARRMSDNCPECLLGLTHASLAMAKDSYNQTARYLAATIAKFPYLPLVDVHPKDFFGKAEDYDECVRRLEKAANANAKDGSALLVLGYLKMRDNLFPVAARLLKEAAKAATGKEQAYAIDVLLRAMDEVRTDALADAPKLSAPVELAWAGLKLALPEGFDFLTPSDPNQFLSGARGAGGTDKPQMISGFAYAVDASVTARMTMDQVAAMMSANLAVAKLTQLEEVEFPYLGTTAVARLYSCQYMDEPVVLVRLCFVREAAPGGRGTPGRLVYVLGMGLLESDVESLLPTFSAVARSVALVDLRRPVDLLPAARRREVSLAEFGFAIQQPQGWTGRRTARGYDMAATDFGLGGGVGLQVQAIATLAAGDIGAKAFGQKVISDRQREGERIDVLSEAPATLAGLAGHEFLVRRTVAVSAASRTATRAAAAGERVEVLEMARLACTKAPDGQTRVFAILVRGQGPDPKALRTVMDTMAGGFRLVKP